MKKKRIILISVIIIGLGFLLNPFYWLMQSSAVKQPDFSIEEENYFKKFGDEDKVFIGRYYENFDSKGNDTLYLNYFNNRTFDYKLVIHSTKNKNILKFEEDSILKISIHIKKEILKNNKFLRYIYIYDDFNEYKFISNNEYLEKIK
ncbi:MULTISPECIES: hypothetical protein [Flavobacterium]|uniref:Uncharacterized protein n=1 Tax=Flavobacterium columnare TaxID=996 RepID=A0AA94EZP5_9FLAO|nr:MULTISPECIES: hypothetical protein [Flavobacterium]MCH4830417.1 hypothetical protein [Flavobacterium columnare]MCH4833647.1 hypothetical protein [Flavobacterium columnare]OXA74572.1 hypothetical protein B0A56_12625 [Flavobacterium columnare NBRC 100251 = ATCC 23463]QYS91236.1 hypothetical protein JJC04_16155 [Flavobacterium covae]